MTQTPTQAETHLHTKAVGKVFNDITTTDKPPRTHCSGKMGKKIPELVNIKMP